MLFFDASLSTPSHGALGVWTHFIKLLNSWGPLGLFSVAVLDSAGVPIIAGVDVLLVDIAASSPTRAVFAATCAIAGSLVGSSLLFAVARKGGEVTLAKYIATKQGARAHRWFERYGLVTIFIPALSPLPLPMKVPVFCAGALKVRWSYFLGVVAAARLIRYFALALFAARYGAQTLLYLKAHALAVVLIALGLMATAVIILQVRDRRGRRKKLLSAAEAR